MTARIYKPARTAMQSGEARTKDWVLEFEYTTPRRADPLMGWTSARETQPQVRLEFDTKEEAIAYATREGIAFTLTEPKPRKPIRKSYADNFRYGRTTNWTH
ncbi:ETC complex I subunit [Hyphomicrobium methylovorum]|uniref:ETC complex I subunit n=1 Tax=Hyphomicrobium methylovorum TaxID=84 RepID=UPI0015E67CA2|nr:ETC complex I subunit [Hyphomicrobium methylovorum]MBA2124737.1 ETC complex I subunit [Hyphomicrobium methylovorum]